MTKYVSKRSKTYHLKKRLASYIRKGIELNEKYNAKIKLNIEYVSTDNRNRLRRDNISYESENNNTMSKNNNIREFDTKFKNSDYEKLSNIDYLPYSLLADDENVNCEHHESRESDRIKKDFNPFTINEIYYENGVKKNIFDEFEKKSK